MDLINRAEVHDLIAKRLSDYLTDETRKELEELDIKVEEDIPTIQAVKTAHWIKTRAESILGLPIYECSECEHGIAAGDNDEVCFRHKYCIYCGAKMLGVQTDSESDNYVYSYKKIGKNPKRYLRNIRDRIDDMIEGSGEE